MEAVSLSWQDIKQIVEQIAQQVEKTDQYQNEELEFVAGEVRGGLIPAVMLSHRLELPLAFHWGHAVGLWVDDIYDTGRTAMPYVMQPNLKTACLVSKVSVPPIDFVGHLGSPDSWVIFPWESQATTRLTNNGTLTYKPVENDSFQPINITEKLMEVNPHLRPQDQDNDNGPEIN